ncbi:hypothetical protein [Nocardioides sp. Iso805N]|uniref:hypothetical protein n=1 Tax=Nocardioides sp. Iso805N TaxID=1283287 RepID=UPI0012F93E16|nr:hypothetical protein [Nocardioides sp. Iso805N]
MTDEGATSPSLQSNDSELPSPAPQFAAHFTDPIYEDVSNDVAPFGGDEGWDMLHTWDERRDELGPTSTVADVLEDDPAELVESGEFDDAVAVRAAGFVLLRLTGHIDAAGKRATLTALDQLIDFYRGAPELSRQREDLDTWVE